MESEIIKEPTVFRLPLPQEPLVENHVNFQLFPSPKKAFTASQFSRSNLSAHGVRIRTHRLCASIYLHREPFDGRSLTDDRDQLDFRRRSRACNSLRKLKVNSCSRSKSIRQLVEYPDEMMLLEIPSGKTTIFKIQLRQSDVGRIIVRNGQTIHAIRALLASSAARHGQRPTLEIVE